MFFLPPFLILQFVCIMVFILPFLICLFIRFSLHLLEFFFLFTVVYSDCFISYASEFSYACTLNTFRLTCVTLCMFLFFSVFPLLLLVFLAYSSSFCIPYSVALILICLLFGDCRSRVHQLREGTTQVKNVHLTIYYALSHICLC